MCNEIQSSAAVYSTRTLYKSRSLSDSLIPNELQLIYYGYIKIWTQLNLKLAFGLQLINFLKKII